MTALTQYELVWAIAGEFEKLSESRLHNLAFLCERAYQEQTGEPLTDASYTKIETGVYSDDLATTIQKETRMAVEETTYEGETIDTVYVPITQILSLSTDVQSIIDPVLQTYRTADNLVERVHEKI